MLEQIENILNTNKKVLVRIYSLEYCIELENGIYNMFPEQYPNKKFNANSLNDLLSNYYIYNESVINNLDRIKILN